MAFARALRLGFDSIKLALTAVNAAFGIETAGMLDVVDVVVGVAAAEDDEAAANWGADGCAAILAIFLFKPVEEDIAKSRKDNAQQ